MAHYRRFFTTLKPNYGVFPIAMSRGEPTKEILDSILIPEELLYACEHQKIHGILPARFPDYSYCTECRDVVELMFKESEWLKLGMS